MRGTYNKLIRLLMVTLILSFALSVPTITYSAQEGFCRWIKVFKDTQLSSQAADYTGDAKIEDGRIIIRESGKGYWSGESESRAGLDRGKNIAGLWKYHHGNTIVAELRFQGPNSQLQGTIKVQNGGVEKLTDISYDGKTLRFMRPNPRAFLTQTYHGTLDYTPEGKLRLIGNYSFINSGGNYAWYAIKQESGSSSSQDSLQGQTTEEIAVSDQPPVIGDPIIKPPATPVTFKVDNKSMVVNGVRLPTTFTFDTPVKLLFLGTYHWNYGKGTSSAGKIGLRHSDGTMYGSWQTKARAGQGGVPNAYWEINPNIQLKPGTYTVVDSDPSTWATNAQSGYKGFTIIRTGPVDYPDEESVGITAAGQGATGPENSRGDAGESESRADSNRGKNIAGLWIYHSGNYVAELRFQGPNSQLQGTIKVQGGGVENLTEISYDGKTLRFMRPNPRAFLTQTYHGTLDYTPEGKLRLIGNYDFINSGGNYGWYAIKQK